MSAVASQKRCIAALDVGTTSVKVCLFTPQLELLACAVQEYALHTWGECAEVEAGQYKAAVRQGLQQALAAAPGWAVAAVGLATQGETLAPVSKAGEALRPFLVWLDSRAGAEAAELSRLLGGAEFYRATGLPEPTGALPLAKLLWLRRHEPAVYQKAHKFLLLEDYLLFWLTGRFVSEKSIQSSTGWFSLPLDGPWPEALAAAGVEPQKLPRLAECGSAVGGLLAQAARELGLPAGVPVVAGAMDQVAAALAAGCVEPGVVTETTGTALVAAACTDAPVFSGGHRVTIYRHALPGRYLYLPIGNTAGMALRWFRDQFCRDLPAGAEGYLALDELAGQVPPGCEGLVFLPFLAGCVDPDSCPQASAVFFGAHLGTTRAHFVRSVLESTAFLLRDFFEMLAALGCPARQVYSLGGGARSPLWQQIKADVCGRSFAVPACSEATAQGAALLAAWGAGLVPAGQLPKARPSAVYRPRSGAAPAYGQAYALYRRLYAAVKPLFEPAPQAERS